jgi:lipopolysaccharide/colanic/teichoic acid biosynthesis glycosyltransferase
LAQLFFTREGRLLDGFDPERQYRDEILPRKLRYDLAYLRRRSWRLDLWILAATPMTLLTGRPPVLPPDVRELVADA